MVSEWMTELQAPGVKMERSGVEGERLGVARDLVIRQVNGVADDGEAELPEVGADLVGAPGDGTGFDESRVVGETFEDKEFGARGKTFGQIDVTGAGFAGFGSDGGVASELICGR